MLALPGVCLGWIRAREGRVGANARASKLDLDPQSSAMTLYTTQGTRCRARAGARTMRTAKDNAATDQRLAEVASARNCSAHAPR